MKALKTRAFWRAIWYFVKEISPTFITAFKRAREIYKENKKGA